MSEAKKELVQTWLRKAQHDLAAARTTIPFLVE